MTIHFMNFANHLSTNLHVVTPYDAIRLVYTYSSFLAIMPLNFKTLNISWKATVPCFFMYFIDGYFAWKYMEDQLQFHHNKMLAFLVPKVFRNAETFLQMVTYSVILKTHLLNNSQLKFILRRITHVDARLGIVQGLNTSHLDETLNSKIHTFFIVFFICSVLSMAFRHLTVTPYSATAIFGFFLPHFQPYAITAQFIILLDLTSNRLDAINGFIRDLKHRHNSKRLFPSKTPLVRGELGTLACIHNDLCDICLLINRYFNIQLLLAVSCHFLSISVAAYTFLSSLGVFFQSESVSTFDVITLVLHTMLWICQRFYILILTAQATIRAQSLVSC